MCLAVPTTACIQPYTFVLPGGEGASRPKGGTSSSPSLPPLSGCGPAAEGFVRAIPSTSPLPFLSQRRSDITKTVGADVPLGRATNGPVRPRNRRRRGPSRPGKTATDKERLFVVHDYHDLSGESDSPHRGNAEASSPGGGLARDSFPLKLHRILHDHASHGVIHWMPHGRAFLIRDPVAFVTSIVPRYFPRMKKLASLQRQLNLYGFERLTRGPDEGAYYHEAFLKGRPELTARRMIRRRVKGTGYKAASNPDAEPDFYSMPFVDGVANSSNFASIEPLESVSYSHVAGFASAWQIQSSEAGFVTESNFNSSSDGSSDESSFPSGAVDQWSFSTPNNGVASASVKQVNASGFVSQSSPKPWVSMGPSPFVVVPAASAHFTPEALPSYAPEMAVSNPGAVSCPQPEQGQLSSTDFGPSIHALLSLPEATQDAFLRDFFAEDDVTPLSPDFDARAADQVKRSDQAAQAPADQAEDRAVLEEFAEIWKRASPNLE